MEFETQQETQISTEAFIRDAASLIHRVLGAEGVHILHYESGRAYLSTPDGFGETNTDVEHHSTPNGERLHTCANIPLTGRDDKVLGVVSLLFAEKRPLTDEEERTLQSLTEALTHQLSMLKELEKLKISNHALVEAIEAIPDGFVIYDKNDRLVISNQAYRDIYHLSAPAIVPGNTFEDIIRFGVSAGQYAAANNMPDGGESWIQERIAAHGAASNPIEQQLEDGRWLKIAEKRTPSDAIVGFRVDITDNKRHSQALTRLNAITTSEASFRSKLEDVLSLGCEVFQCEIGILSQIDASSYSVVNIFSKVSRPSVAQNFDATSCLCAKALRSGTAVGETWAVPTTSENSHPCYQEKPLGGYLGAPLTVNGEPFGTVNFTTSKGKDLPYSESELALVNLISQWMGSEITRNQTLFDLNNARKEAEAASKAKSAFLANMSHEIRTPLNGIIGFSQILQTTALTQAQQDYVGNIALSSENLLGVINDILDFSKIEAGEIEFEEIPFDLTTVVDNLGAMLGGRAHSKGVELIISIDPDTPVKLMGDPLRLSQVLMNFTSNSIKFTETGTITIGVEPISVTADTATLHFYVADTGIGMTSNQLARIFTPFSQADTSTTRRFGGTGLGLTISQDFVKKMQSEIKVTSAPGKGSRFSFDVNLALDGNIATFRDAEPVLPRQSTALVIEDNPLALTATTQILESLGFEVATATDLETARNHLTAERPSVVLASRSISEADANSTFSKFIKDAAGETQSFWLLTTKLAPPELYDEAAALGYTAVLSKPLTKAKVKASLESAIKNPNATGPKRPDATSSEVMLTGMRTLLADDNEINRLVAVSLLETVGVDVETAENGLIACQKITSKPTDYYDAVLMDIQMPELDGLSATKQIKATTGFEDLPVIAMTAHASDAERQKSFDAGMCAHLTKPIERDRLIDALTPHLKRRNGPDKSTNGSAGSPDWSSLPARDDDRTVDAIRSMSQIDGEALLSTLQNAELACVLLRQFARENASIGSAIAGHHDEGRRDDLKALVHQLKGVAGNLRISMVYKACVSLENALKAGEENVVEQVSEIQRELVLTLSEIQELEETLSEASSPAEPNAAPKPSATLGSSEIKAHLQSVIDLLDEGSFDAEERWQAMRDDIFHSMTDADHQTIQDIDAAIQQLNFETAKDGLVSLLPD